MAVNVRPLHDYVLVRRLEAPEKTEGGIYIPDVAREKSQQGEVVAVGPGKKTKEGKLIPPDVKVGDIVIFNKYAGSDFERRSTAIPVKIGDQDYLIVREEELLGVVQPAAVGATK